MSEQQTLRIGQIIYILSNKTQSVVPAIIAGRTIAETLDGQAVSYKVKVGPPDKSQIVDLNRIDGELYTNLEDIRALLLKNLNEFVNSLIANTQDKVNNWYGAQGQLTAMSGHPSQKLDPEQLMNAVENGMPVQSVPTVQQNHPLMLQGGPQQRPQSVHEKLRDMVAPPDDEGGGLLGDVQEAVVMPDGTIVNR